MSLSALSHWRNRGTPTQDAPVFTTAPTISGTKGGILTVTPGTATNAVSSSFQFYRDLIPIPGATLTSFDSAAWPGLINVVQTATDANGVTAAAISNDFDNGDQSTYVGQEMFEEPSTAGQKYDTINGRTLSMVGGDLANRDLFIVQSNGTGGPHVLTGAGNITPVTVNGKPSTPVAYLDADLGINHRVEIDCNRRGPYTKPSQVILRFVDEFNYLILQLVGNAIYLNSVVNGNTTSLLAAALNGGTGSSIAYLPRLNYTSSYTLRADITGSAFHLFDRIDGETSFHPVGIYHLGNPSTLLQIDFDLNAAGVASLPQGHKAGVQVSGTAPGVDNVRFYSLNAPLLMTAVSSSTSANVPTLTIHLEYSGSIDPTGFDVGVMDFSGKQVLPRIACSSILSMGNGSATITIADPRLRAIENRNAHIQVWKTGPGLNGNEGAARTFIMPAYQTVFPMNICINETFTASDKGNTDPFRDLFFAGRWIPFNGPSYGSTSPSDVFSKNGLPLLPSVAYPTSWNLALKSPLHLTPDRYDSFIVYYPPDMSVAPVSGAATVTATGIPGQARLTRQPDGTVGLLRFGGRYFTEADVIKILPEHDAHPERLIPDQTAANYAALGNSIRFMEARQVNSSLFKSTTPTTVTRYSVADEWARGTSFQVPYTIEQAVSACNQADRGLYWNAKINEGEDIWRRDAAYYAANAAATLPPPFVELQNEIWNMAGTFKATRQFALEGVRMGFADDTASSFSAAVAPSNGVYDNAGSDSVTTVAIPDGGLLMTGIGGLTVWRAIGAQGTNVALPSSTSDTSKPFALVYTNQQCANARVRYQAFQSDRLWQIWNEEMAKAKRAPIISVFGGQYTSAGVVGSVFWTGLDFIPRSVSDDTSQTPLRNRVNRLCIAPYWGNYTLQPGTGGSLGDYNANFQTPLYPVPWTAAEKALVASDMAEFLNAFFAIAPYAIDFTIEKTQATKLDLAAGLVTRGMSADAIQLMSYECAHGIVFCNWPTTTPALSASADIAYAAIFRDQRYGDLVKRYLIGLRDKIGGDHFWYARGGELATSGSKLSLAAGGEKSWSMMEYETDNSSSNYRFTALAAARLGNYS